MSYQPIIPLTANPSTASPATPLLLSTSSTSSSGKGRHWHHDDYTQTLGEDIPFRDPNVREGEDGLKDLVHAINGKDQEPPGDCSTCFYSTLCALTGIGLCYMTCAQVLIPQGSYGFSINNGTPEILLPGRQLLWSPLNRYEATFSALDPQIRVGPVWIIRVQRGQLGFAMNNAIPEILLPGIHVRNSGNYKFDGCQSVAQDEVMYGPIKFITVKSGFVRVCYWKGKVHIYPEGRYAINEPNFVLSTLFNTQQQNYRFDKHPVFLDGGISMLVEGLLTFQVVDVELLVRQLGDRDLLRSITDVSKAELSRVFSAIHLEQISSAQSHPDHVAAREAKGEIDSDAKAILGNSRKDEPEGEVRSAICSHVVEYISPITEKWGVKIINFQLESIKLADASYAREYEQASLAMAKAKAGLRAVKAENDISLSRAEAEARALKIEAEGKKGAAIIQATGEAEARKIDASSRNEAARMMTDEFAKQFALAGQQVDFAKGLRASVLTVLPDNSVRPRQHHQ